MSNGFRFLPVLLSTTVLAASGATAPAGAPAPHRESQWVFSLLPRAFQKNPRLDLTVITEVTDAGKRLPPVSPAHPAYFEAYAAGYHPIGDETAEHALSEKDIRTVLDRALRADGYVAAQRPAHPPSILIIYTWGSDNLLIENNPDDPTLSPAAVEKNLLDRAALIGGRKFAEDLGRAFADANDGMTSTQAAPSDGSGAGPAPATMGLGNMDISNPVEQFRRRSEKNEFLVDQVASNIYYVVASTYDYRSATTKERVLLWRTRMTVGADGVSQQQTLPTLVLSAGPYFGKEMAEPEVFTKRAVPDGNVELGPTRVVRVEDTPDSPSTAEK